MFGHQGMALLGGVILLECEWPNQRKCTIGDRVGGFKTPGQTQVLSHVLNLLPLDLDGER